jgi:hypothetical protein
MISACIDELPMNSCNDSILSGKGSRGRTNELEQRSGKVYGQMLKGCCANQPFASFDVGPKGSALRTGFETLRANDDMLKSGDVNLGNSPLRHKAMGTRCQGKSGVRRHNTE